MNLNMDIGDLFKRKNSGGRGGSNPFIGQIVTILIIAILAGSYIGLYWLPKSAQLTTFRTQAAEIDSLRMRREQLDRDIVISGQQLADARTTYESVTRLFHTDQELEDLYRRLSTLAQQHGLMISKVTKGMEIPIYEESVEAKPAGEEPELDQQGNPIRKDPPLYYRIKVSFQIIGRYPAYEVFRRDLASEGKIINIDSEVIETGKEEAERDQGWIKIALGLSTYRIAG